MVVYTTSHAGEFLKKASAFLLEREAENGMVLGLAERLASHGRIAGVQQAEAPVLSVVEEEGKVLLAGLRTPPHKLIVSHGSMLGVAVLADWLARQRAGLPGVFGPVETAEAFATAWKKLSRQKVAVSKSLRLYQVERVVAPTGTAGQLVAATKEQIDLLAGWQEAFAVEVHDPVVGNHREFVESAVAEGRLFVWMDGKPVSMAAWSRPTRNGVSINLVYTPPEQRRRGYATACVAALSQRLLEGGKRFCCLFTDLGNPTANRIYQQVGYRGVGDYREYRFEG